MLSRILLQSHVLSIPDLIFPIYSETRPQSPLPTLRTGLAHLVSQVLEKHVFPPLAAPLTKSYSPHPLSYLQVVSRTEITHLCLLEAPLHILH